MMAVCQVVQSPSMLAAYECVSIIVYKCCVCLMSLRLFAVSELRSPSNHCWAPRGNTKFASKACTKRDHSWHAGSSNSALWKSPGYVWLVSMPEFRML